MADEVVHQDQLGGTYKHWEPSLRRSIWRLEFTPPHNNPFTPEGWQNVIKYWGDAGIHINTPFPYGGTVDTTTRGEPTTREERERGRVVYTPLTEPSRGIPVSTRAVALAEQQQDQGFKIPWIPIVLIGAPLIFLAVILK